MENLETYNRVQSLESPLFKNFLLCSYVLLIFIALAAGVSFFITENAWPYALITVFVTVLAYILLTIFDYMHTKSCQYCHQQLGHVVRPFLLTQKYLSMQGFKKGDYFYTQYCWGNNPFQKRWAKISNRSLACHHCRLTEEKQTEHYEAVSPDELDNKDI
ncbi:MAG: hypothetical protein V3T17_19770 [Pseudomonadales bacterium]